jgi:apolipoprotein N-acyltransferase
MWWVLRISRFGFFPLTALQCVYAPMFVLLLSVVRRSWPRPPVALLAGVLWGGVEFLRGELVLTGFAWGLLGHACIDAPVLSWPAKIGGVYLVSACCAALASACVDMCTNIRRGAISAGVLCCAWACVGAAWRAPSPSERLVRIGLVQTNVPQDNKLTWTIVDEVRDFRNFVELTRRAAERDASGRRPDLIVWPETMMPGPTLEPSALRALADAGVIFKVPEGVADPPGNALAATVFADELLAEQERLGVPLLIGEESLEGFRVRQDEHGVEFSQDKRFNSAYVLQEGRITRQRYDKVRLTPFGEYMPVISRWNWLEAQLLVIAAGGMRFDLSEGRSVEPLRLPFDATRDGLRVATPICFEVTDAAHCRRLAWNGSQRRADVLVNLTNDGWFTDSDLARRQHLLAARWRAVELETPVVRCANTGISCMIDLQGRVLDARGSHALLPPRTDGVHIADAALPSVERAPTIFAKAGNVVGWGFAILSLAACIAAYAKQRANSRTRPLHAK